ncbi:Protein-L-isoaspartate O-methyltransferase [BD1-7 clade bacterium]|uniref:Protein-L-isoaspartate O-methyltransferase n=1 Tax=BD1-7 clade bacterium TaxID=2029982 RepID=A0A5S9PCF4_9GAMM|nr:Protein-L-isoaspartate O-methyltransferase [BD1-7 clade bacterium]CAA0102294.1 Protein-L-isoaspartate O-methyltransferase [BD1-7 clade bacterium]
MKKLDLSGIGMTSLRTRNRLIDRLRNQGIKNLDVLEAMLATPRHIFVDEALSHRAYEDTALPIGHNQTISQPYVVARMTELLQEGGKLGKVLEVGTGSGYQMAVLAQLVDTLYSVERIRPLLDKARQRARLLKIDNVRFLHADGSLGWGQYGPFDGILSAAAPSRVPENLLEQLALGGRLVMPVGDSRRQELVVVDRTEDGFEERTIEPVKFVPLVSGATV